MQYSPDLLSDTTLNSISAYPNKLVVEITLYTEEKRTLVFEGFKAIEVNPEWSKPSSIEVLSVNKTSGLLKDVIKKLKDTDGLKSFQFIGDGTLVEIIALDLKVVKPE
jgi:hypothetical protein